ncbi:MAG: amidase family protein [Tuberibacillus sp.]
MEHNIFPAEADIQSLQKALTNGEWTSVQLVHFYLEQIARFNETVNAVLEVNPDAEFIAAVLDAERKQKGPRGPLHGIPVLIKDNIDTGDHMHTSAGSIALKDSYADQDAFVAKKLREAGAIILGKANMTEWANFMSDHMPSGYSSRGGQVQNPYGPGRFDVGGSSSGSGAAVAANFAAVAIGTETSGSILNPASQNNIVGIKPTIGLVSRSGIIPIAHSQDTAGPLARTVSDAAILLNAIVGEDADDPVTGLAAYHAEKDYTDFLRPEGLKGKRIGVPRSRFYDELPEDVLKKMNEAFAVMRELGAEIVDPVEIPAADAEENIDVLIYEFKLDLNAYLRKLAPHVPVHSLKDLVAFNGAHADQALRYGQSLLEASEKTSGTLADREYIHARLNDLDYSQKDGINKVMEEYNLDAIAFYSSWGAGIAAKAGYPSICVPAGFTSEGEPVGLSLTARAFEEGKLIEMGYSFEQATKFRKAPNLK